MEQENNQKKLAVLIDAENTQASLKPCWQK